MTSLLISYPISCLISFRLDCFHYLIRKMQEFSQAVKLFWQSSLPSMG